MSRKTQYTEEFKQQIVDLYNSGINTVKSLSSEYGVSTVTIYEWIKKLSPIKISDEEEISAKDHAKMQKRIAELEMENEILKKLQPYSQENSKRNSKFYKHF